MSSNPATRVQELLDLYLERKNSQGGAVTYTRLELVSSTPSEQRIQFEGLHNDTPFTDAERAILASRLFPSFARDFDDKAVAVKATPEQMTECIVDRVDNVVVYPHTEHLRTILSKLLPPDYLTEEILPCLLPYPHNAKPLGEFVYNDLRGFYTHDRHLIDPSQPAGAILQIPYYEYDEHSPRVANVAILALAAMGLRLPFSHSTVQLMEREICSDKQKFWFPKMIVPADGRVGFNTLSGYAGSNFLQIAIMEEPEIIAATFARFVKNPRAISSTALLQNLQAG